MLEQGSKFASWEDVFPDAKDGAGTGAGEQQGVISLADSDDSDDPNDESFKVRAQNGLLALFFFLSAVRSRCFSSCEGYSGFWM